MQSGVLLAMASILQVSPHCIDSPLQAEQEETYWWQIMSGSTMGTDDDEISYGIQEDRTGETVDSSVWYLLNISMCMKKIRREDMRKTTHFENYETKILNIFLMNSYYTSILNMCTSLYNSFFIMNYINVFRMGKSYMVKILLRYGEKRYRQLRHICILA